MDIDKNEKKRRQNKAKLKKIYSGIPENKLKFAYQLIDIASFSAAAIEELQEIILATGYVVEYKNGENQFGTKDNPAVKMRVAEITNLLKIMEALTDMSAGESVSDELDKFLKTVREIKPVTPVKVAKRGKK